ncbi:MAG: hypothetical protein JOZ27_00150 [Caulobacteraceae bacterium]|nr:hypothetical protein [Caulobacteraceae bacterium]
MAWDFETDPDFQKKLDWWPSRCCATIAYHPPKQREAAREKYAKEISEVKSAYPARQVERAHV